MKETVFIPKKCKVGFNERTDTYTGKLGYVIYHDGKVWRKETSWEDWRMKYIDPDEAERKRLSEYNDMVKNYFERAKRNGGNLKNEWLNGKYVTVDNVTSEEDIMKVFKYESYERRSYKESADRGIIPMEFENVPMEGFVLNKKAGGTKYGWNPRQTYCRVYDPRGFEFEITIPNLLYILENTNSIKGKGLDGKFIYGWDKKDLVLIPEDSPEYENMVKFSELQDGKVLKKTMVPGNKYLNREGKPVTYMGDFFEVDYYGQISEKKKIWFMSDDNRITSFTSVQSIKKDLGETNENFANLMGVLEKDKSCYTHDVIEYELANNDDVRKSFKENSYHTEGYYIKESDNTFKHIRVWKRNQYRSFSGSSKESYHVSIGKHEYEFDNVEQLLNKYTLWQLKTTK